MLKENQRASTILISSPTAVVVAAIHHPTAFYIHPTSLEPPESTTLRVARLCRGVGVLAACRFFSGSGVKKKKKKKKKIPYKINQASNFRVAARRACRCIIQRSCASGMLFFFFFFFFDINYPCFWYQSKTLVWTPLGGRANQTTKTSLFFLFF